MAGLTVIELLILSPLTAAAGGLNLASEAAAWIGKRMIERYDVKRDEITYIYVVQERSKQCK